MIKSGSFREIVVRDVANTLRGCLVDEDRAIEAALACLESIGNRPSFDEVLMAIKGGFSPYIDWEVFDKKPLSEFELR